MPDDDELATALTAWRESVWRLQDELLTAMQHGRSVSPDTIRRLPPDRRAWFARIAYRTGALDGSTALRIVNEEQNDGDA